MKSNGKPLPPWVHVHDLDDLRPDGVDVTLVRWMLSLTPAERLARMQSAVNSLEQLRKAVRDHQGRQEHRRRVHPAPEKTRR